MSKQVYISADYANDGDKSVVKQLISWGKDNKHKVNFIDMSNPSSGSVAEDEDCRSCDLKAEFNKQINSSSVVICIVGDRTKIRMAGSACHRNEKSQFECTCTPYKQNTNGKKICKVFNKFPVLDDNVGNINSFSYLQHEFEQAKKKNKSIIILYNSTRCESTWLPSYMFGYQGHPFWKYDRNGNKVGDYEFIKKELGF